MFVSNETPYLAIPSTTRLYKALSGCIVCRLCLGNGVSECSLRKHFDQRWLGGGLKRRGPPWPARKYSRDNSALGHLNDFVRNSFPGGFARIYAGTEPPRRRPTRRWNSFREGGRCRRCVRPSGAAKILALALRPSLVKARNGTKLHVFIWGDIVCLVHAFKVGRLHRRCC